MVNYGKWLLVTISLVTLSLFGCATYHNKYQNYQAKSQQEKLSKVTSWSFGGVLSVINQHQSEVVYFNWRQHHDDYLINLSGPMNLNWTSLIGNKKLVKVCRRQKCSESKFTDQWLNENFGLSIKAINLRYWIFGVPVPELEVQEAIYDSYGRLVKFIQGGWQIKVSEFRLLAIGETPRVLELTNKETRIKIKINSCKVN
jgi:Outer membrane lipoprotein involved in outer membrane biogenesis